MSKDPRQSIIDAAEKLFLQYGYRRTTVEDIAKAAGIAKGSVYMHFDSKEAIFIALGQRVEQQVLDAMRTTAQTNGCPLKRAKRAYVNALTRIWDYCHQAPHAPDIWAENLTSMPDDPHADAKKQADRIVATILTEGQEKGLIRAELDPAETAHLLRLGCWVFSAPYIEAEIDSREQIEQTLPKVLDMMIYGIAAGRAEKEQN